MTKFIFISKKIHREAIHMRDATKIIVMRQEHNSQSTTKARNKLASDFRQQVDEHKQELERLERKLLTISNIQKINIYKIFYFSFFSFNCTQKIFQQKQLCNKEAWNRYLEMFY